ncbi:MAG: tryptophan synthase subunit beta [Nitrosopumilus sp.]|nr:tryptophan synthase subunit beta [Nitrosopumilus sp.]CAI9831335.1 tryptophan synthase, beta subunit [Nitrosopumilaceae archaeon]MDA7944288.1 tryptophan synthase subunit beta [Nitrosopumilus sp.]MDA7952386.1 tryptophan synthase subunit beta [Nitrosopumilus sp.]MDA7954040.1 tryptophan synthase subunit beta [Nitrosopumilus sp.]
MTGFGGRYVPETLVPALDRLESDYARLSRDPGFRRELGTYLSTYAGRPTPVYYAANLTRRLGGARIYLKREDLLHGGAHKMNNALGQALLAKRSGSGRIIAETGAGQHGVATAMACAALGMKCEVYMGAKDMRRQRPNVLRMRLLGARVVPAGGPDGTLRDAIGDAIRDWTASVRTTHYLLGSAVGPRPYPAMVRGFQSVIGREARSQMRKMGRRIDAAVACVGGGSNAVGTFAPLLGTGAELVGVEAGGSGLKTGRHAATLAAGRPGILHGMRSYILQDAEGQVSETHSVSAGLDYPGVGPDHAGYKESGRARYVTATDREALGAFAMLAEEEGIIPALESAHAIAGAARMAPRMKKSQNILVTLSGRGDKDIDHAGGLLGIKD